MFTERMQAVLDMAKDYAYSSASIEIDCPALLAAICGSAEATVLLAESLGLRPETVREKCGPAPQPAGCPGKMRLSEAVRELLGTAKGLAEQVPDRLTPGLINLRHLAAAAAMSPDLAKLLGAAPISVDHARTLLTSWWEREDNSPRLDELTARLRTLREELLKRVFGQDHAVHDFVEGLFNAEVVAAADEKRKAPRALFVFAGPPGVGKTFLAELGASHLDRPFKRFDMSAYSSHHQSDALVGMSKSYHGAHPGVLTEFVEKNPNAIILFDEIEKAHATAIHFFLQILDAGILEDKYNERNVVFRDTTLIFTSNAGRKLYDRPNESGVHRANAGFHRRTILDALETEINPLTREPFFPAAICSRMATGYPILFNHLRVNELERVSRAEISRVAGLLEMQYYKRVTFDPLLPMALVLREGARADARTLRSQAEAFVKTELFQFCRMFKTDRLEEVFSRVESLHFELQAGWSDAPPEVRSLFEARQVPQVLLIADQPISELYKASIPEVEWRSASNAADALQILGTDEVDLVLLDLWLGQTAGTPSNSLQLFDHTPAAARSLDAGQELLKKIRERLPNLPVFLLSLTGGRSGEESEGKVDSELFMACVRGGGARGAIASGYATPDDDAAARAEFTGRLLETCRRLHRENAAERMGQERKVLGFDTVPHLDSHSRVITVSLRNFRLTRAVAAADAGEVMEEVERPRTRFDEVIGATAAKEELRFFIDYLKNPKRLAALGLKPPKGVLLYGPPGTGKTMLARAMAGESNVAFLQASGSSFVTIWQGSGPQNVRDLFARARRYAPAIVFIDEIDAIGRVRRGGGGGDQAGENTLNALLTEMDGFTGPSPDRPVFVLAATNFKVETGDQDAPERTARALDPALVRRFSRSILVDLPERAARREYLVRRLGNRPACVVSGATLDLIAERSSGMSIANLEAIIDTAAREAAKAGVDMTDRILEDALEKVQFGEARSRDAETVRRTARHEAGHTILYWLSGWIPSYVTVVARGGHGGYMAPSAEEIENRGSRTRAQLLADIRVSLGGRAAEVLYYGAEAGISTGASQDLEHATNLARSMVCRYGMSEEFGVAAAPELMKYEAALGSPLFLKMSEIAAGMLAEEMQNTRQLLEQNRARLEAVVDALVQKERLNSQELQSILGPATLEASSS